MTTRRKFPTLFAFVLLAIIGVVAIDVVSQDDSTAKKQQRRRSFDNFGIVGDGVTDDTAAIQACVDAGVGNLRFPKGKYKITKTILVELDRVGQTSFSSDGTATIEMHGAGPAIRFVGTHEGTASPATVKPNVWERQRTPMVDAIEIVGKHAEADGIEATGTMELVVSRVIIRHVRHGVRLVKRNRNVTLSECNIYENSGVGVFLDRLNLHQINIANCHISYNAAGGVVAKQSEIRNLQIGTCDIEGNMGGEDSEPTANVLLDSTGTSIGEVAIVGCTIQHSHDAPQSANIRILGRCTKRPFTDELRHGNITIANNVLSDVQFNIDLHDVRAASVTGNTIWKGYDHNLRITGCKNIVVSSNVFDRNPRYHYGDGTDSKLAISVVDSQDCIFNANQLCGTGDIPVAMQLTRCKRVQLSSCSIVDYAHAGLRLNDCENCRVTHCLIDSEVATGDETFALRIVGGKENRHVGTSVE